MNIAKLLKQTAVYWRTPVNDGYGGYAFATPIEIACRWEDKFEKFLSKTGEEFTSQSVVYSKTDFEVGGYLFLGTLIELDSTQNPQVQTGALLIQGTAKIPSIKGSNFLRKAWL